jgi:hypothetical protein
MRRLIVMALVAGVMGAQPAGRLRANIERIARGVNAQWGIYVKVLETGEEIAIDADRQMDTMSTIKNPLMIETFRQIEAADFLRAGRHVPAGFLVIDVARAVDEHRSGLTRRAGRGHLGGRFGP